MTHIAVERNQRRQMNDHLTTVHSIMPFSYIQRVGVLWWGVQHRQAKAARRRRSSAAAVRQQSVGRAFFGAAEQGFL
ncbi:hypothetical protein Vadar_026549 [Vaccinium darrowii]|uniref:Uncharacterized protein n=1 Tax=Vaccinium darrowii TaxID=229202 RepID=A0ACB7YR06_9ERIC|nr:hypothetical protein Vadar_026549 [Vaccinium darrowii]